MNIVKLEVSFIKDIENGFSGLVVSDNGKAVAHKKGADLTAPLVQAKALESSARATLSSWGEEWAKEMPARLVGNTEAETEFSQAFLALNLAKEIRGDVEKAIAAASDTVEAPYNFEMCQKARCMMPKLDLTVLLAEGWSRGSWR